MSVKISGNNIYFFFLFEVKPTTIESLSLYIKDKKKKDRPTKKLMRIIDLYSYSFILISFCSFLLLSVVYLCAIVSDNHR